MGNGIQEPSCAQIGWWTYGCWNERFARILGPYSSENGTGKIGSKFLRYMLQ